MMPFSLFFNGEGVVVVSEYLAKAKRYFGLNAVKFYVGRLHMDVEKLCKYFDVILPRDLSWSLHEFAFLDYNKWMDYFSDKVFWYVANVVRLAINEGRKHIVVVCDEKDAKRCIRNHICEFIRRCFDSRTLIDPEVVVETVRGFVMYGEFWIGRVDLPEFGTVIVVRLITKRGEEYHVVSHDDGNVIESALMVSKLKGFL